MIHFAIKQRFVASPGDVKSTFEVTSVSDKQVIATNVVTGEERTIVLVGESTWVWDQGDGPVIDVLPESAAAPAEVKAPVFGYALVVVSNHKDPREVVREMISGDIHEDVSGANAEFGDLPDNWRDELLNIKPKDVGSVVAVSMTVVQKYNS